MTGLVKARGRDTMQTQQKAKVGSYFGVAVTFPLGAILPFCVLRIFVEWSIILDILSALINSSG